MNTKLMLAIGTLLLAPMAGSATNAPDPLDDAPRAALAASVAQLADSRVIGLLSSNVAVTAANAILVFGVALLAASIAHRKRTGAQSFAIRRFGLVPAGLHRRLLSLNPATVARLPAAPMDAGSHAASMRQTAAVGFECVGRLRPD